MLCTTTVSPSRTKASSESSSGPLGVLARRLVGEHPAHFDMLQLPFRVLVEAADADIADALTLHDAYKGKSVRMKSITLCGFCQ